MKTIMAVIAIVIAIKLLGCSNPLDTLIPIGADGKFQDNAAFTQAVSELEDADKQLLAKYTLRMVGRAAFLREPVPTRTIAQALEYQKKFEAEQAEEALKASQEESIRLAEEQKIRTESEERAAHLQSLAGVWLVSKEYIPSDYSARRYKDAIAMTMRVKNNSQKTLSGVKGSFIIQDMFGEVILEIATSIAEEIPPQSSIDYKTGIDYNEFISSHEAFRFADINKIKTVWIPEQIVYSDGSIEH